MILGTKSQGRSEATKSSAMFLASLPDEDRQFLEFHEGLGNSQKAEVAWLERRLAETGNEGYRYEEVDVRDFQLEDRTSGTFSSS